MKNHKLFFLIIVFLFISIIYVYFTNNHFVPKNIGQYSQNIVLDDYVDKEDSEKLKLIEPNIINYRKNTEYDIEDNIKEKLCLIPYDLLYTFFNQGFKLIISLDSINDSTNTLANIDYNNKYITFYIEDKKGDSIIHEFGHWFTYYIEEKYDSKIFKRVSNNMIKEIDNIDNISPFYKKYYRITPDETCAALFESYILSKGENNKLPISTTFYNYYLNIFREKLK